MAAVAGDAQARAGAGAAEAAEAEKGEVSRRRGRAVHAQRGRGIASVAAHGRAKVGADSGDGARRPLYASQSVRRRHVLRLRRLRRMSLRRFLGVRRGRWLFIKSSPKIASNFRGKIFWLKHRAICNWCAMMRFPKISRN